MDKNKKKILLIEDDPDQVLMYKIEFEKSGFEFLTTYNQEEAIKITSKEKPDLILLDMLIQNTSGMKILELLKANPKTKKFKIVILSNYKKEGLPKECIEKGATDYLLKTDFTPKELVKKIGEYL